MKLGRELPSQIRISCVPLSKGRSFSSSNGRRSLLPAIEPTDTVDYTPSNKNQSASFPILFVFSFFFFWNFSPLPFSFFFFFIFTATSLRQRHRTRFLYSGSRIEEISRISLRFVFACVYPAYKFNRLFSLVFRILWMRRIINQIAYGILWKSFPEEYSIKSYGK